MNRDCLHPRGLREAKKQKTRSALSEAALDLVSRHGYEATTVEAIAGAAGVSVRTFHNYFPSKAAALAHLAADLVREYGETLRDQPDTVSCAQALHDTWLIMLGRHRENVTELVTLIDAIETNPDLRRNLEDNHLEVSDTAIDEIARRLGVDPETSAIPRVVNEITFTLAVTVTRLHGTPGLTGRTHDQLLDEAFAALPKLVAIDPTDPHE